MENKTLILDLVEWIAECPRSYTEVMDAWQTTCPRLAIWEDAIDKHFLRVQRTVKREKLVFVTEKGTEFLKTNGRCCPTD